MKTGKKISLTIQLLLLTALLFGGCKKAYITGGKIEDVNKYINVSTYDVLSSMPQFDTLIQLIDAGGLKESINQSGSTFFALKNGAISSYLQLRTLDAQVTDQDAKFPLDSLLYYVKNNIHGTKDSLLMYLVPKVLAINMLSATGQIYPTGLKGDTVLVSYESTQDPLLGYSGLVSTAPRILYVAQLWKHYNLNTTDSTAADLPSETGVRVLVATSFINTKNGIINALTNSIPLFYYRTRKL